MKIKTVNNLLNYRGFLTILVAFLLCISFGTATLQAQDYIDKAKEGLKKLGENGDLLDSCKSYEGMEAKGGCTTADKAGKGLNCPETNLATGGDEEDCDRDIWNDLKGVLGAAGIAKLEGSNLNSAQMHVIITPIESASHEHKTCGGPDECGEKFIKRKDFVQFKMAVFNSSEVSVGITDPDFNLQVKNSEGFTDSFSALICGWKDHEGERTCTPEPCTPDEEPVEPVEPTGEPGSDKTEGEGQENPGIPLAYFFINLLYR